MINELYEPRIVSSAIKCSPDDVYEFARNVENLPLWASGLSSGVGVENGQWYANSPMGKVMIDFAPHNPFGVLDHDVTLPDGKSVYNAFRVTRAGSGSVVAFTVLRMPGASAADFDKDCEHVASDLRALKSIMERA